MLNATMLLLFNLIYGHLKFLRSGYYTNLKT
jgi:hypothetical protein